MHDPGDVRRIEGVADLRDDECRPIGLQSDFGTKQFGQRRPVDELHGEEDLAFNLPDLIDGENVRVSERCHDPRFSKEALSKRLLRGAARGR